MIAWMDLLIVLISMGAVCGLIAWKLNKDEKERLERKLTSCRKVK